MGCARQVSPQPTCHFGILGQGLKDETSEVRARGRVISRVPNAETREQRRHFDKETPTETTTATLDTRLSAIRVNQSQVVYESETERAGLLDSVFAHFVSLLIDIYY